MAKHLPDASGAANSTAEAAQRWRSRAKRGWRPSPPARRRAEILASEIEDHPENQTRFVLTGTACPRRPVTTRRRSCASSARTGPVRPRHPAGVRGARDQHHQARVAAHSDLGDYRFIDFEGHLDDELVADVSATSRQAGEGQVPRLYPLAGADGHQRRKAVTACMAARTHGWAACLSRSAASRDRPKRLRDEPNCVGIEHSASSRAHDQVPIGATRRERLDRRKAAYGAEHGVEGHRSGHPDERRAREAGER